VRVRHDPAAEFELSWSCVPFTMPKSEFAGLLSAKAIELGVVEGVESSQRGTRSEPRSPKAKDLVSAVVSLRAARAPTTAILAGVAESPDSGRYPGRSRLREACAADVLIPVLVPTVACPLV